MVSPARKAGTSSRLMALPSSVDDVGHVVSSRVPQVSRGIGVCRSVWSAPCWPAAARSPCGRCSTRTPRTRVLGAIRLADWTKEQVCHSGRARREIGLSAGSPLGQHDRRPGVDRGPAQPVAGLLVHPQVARAAGAGEEHVRRRRRAAPPPRSCSSRIRPSPRPCRSGATISRPMSQSSPSQARPGPRRPAGRRGGRPARCPWRRARPARRRATRAAPGSRRRVGVLLLDPAGALQREHLARVGRLGRAGTSHVVEARAERVREVGPALGRAAYGLLVAPGGDRGVVAGQQHRRARRGRARWRAWCRRGTPAGRPRATPRPATRRCP